MSTDVQPGRIVRAVVIACIGIVLVGASAFGKPSTRRAPVQIPDQVDVVPLGAATFGTPSAISLERATPVVARPTSASVTWFCAGESASATRLIFTNTASSPRVASMSFAGAASPRSFSVPAQSAVGVDLSGASQFGVTIESRRSGLVVSQRIVTKTGTTTASCATSSSASWFFAGGDTQRGATERLVLYNPFDTLATADVTFLTPDGFRHPQATQGLAVPARTVVIVDVNSVQNRRVGLGSAVTTRAGRVVAWRAQSFDGTGPKLDSGTPPKGVSFALGLSVPLTTFTLPTLVTGQGVSSRIVLANPGATHATVTLSMQIDGLTSPPVMTIGLLPGEVKVLGASDLRAVPPGVPFGVTGRVTAGGAVAAEAWLDAAEPAKGVGAYATPALPVTATRWLAPVGLAGAPLDQLGVQTFDKATTIQLWMIHEGRRRRLTGPSLPRKISARSHVTLDLATLLAKYPGVTVEVRSSAPVVVSRVQAGKDAKGLVSLGALPFSNSISGS